MKTLLGRHWRGQLQPLTSVIGIGIGFAGIIVACLRLGLIFGRSLELPLRLEAGLNLLWLVLGGTLWAWVVVGAWRSLQICQFKEKVTGAFFLLAGSVLLANHALSSAQSAGELGLIFADRDPLGPPADIRVVGETVYLNGIISLGTVEKFDQAVSAIPRFREVVLSSPGGRIAEARDLASRIQEVQASTRAEGNCLSACTIILLSGRNRTATPLSSIGFHQPTFAGFDTDDEKISAKQLSERLRASGVSDWFIEKSENTANNSMWYPTIQELLASNFLTDIDLSPQIKGAANYINSLAPKRIDDITTLVSATADGSTLIIRYHVEIHKDQTDFQSLEGIIQNEQASRLCSAKESRDLISLGANYRIEYIMGERIVVATVADCP